MQREKPHSVAISVILCYNYPAFKLTSPLYMRKLFSATLAAILISTINVSSVLASGNPYGPYNPYEPHEPLPTGFGDTNTFYLVALVTFTVGMIILAIAKDLKGKQSAV